MTRYADIVWILKIVKVKSYGKTEDKHYHSLL